MTISTRAARRVAELWQLGNVKKITALHKGLQTPKAKLETDQGIFVVSRHNLTHEKSLVAKSPKSFGYEIALLEHLRGLPVPVFLQSVNGKYLEQIDGDWMTVDLFVSGAQPRRITPKMARILGEFLGEFHVQGAGFNRPLAGRRRFYDLSPSLVRKMHPLAARQKNRELAAVVEEVYRGVEVTRPPAALPQGPIHVDIKPENELWRKEKLAAVLDFGNFYRGPLMIDLGKTIMWNCVHKRVLDRKLADALIAGYESRRKLTAAERRYLPKAVSFAIYSHVWVDLYHVPLGYVPESYTLSLVREFLPVARSL